MLLGWVCIGCQEAVEAKTPAWSKKPVAPERCPSCGANVFQRIERITAAEGLYPDRQPEQTVTDGNSAAFWESDGGAPAYGTGVDQDCDVAETATFEAYDSVAAYDHLFKARHPDKGLDFTVENIYITPPEIDLSGLELGTFLATYYRHIMETNE